MDSRPHKTDFTLRMVFPAHDSADPLDGRSPSERQVPVLRTTYSSQSRDFDQLPHTGICTPVRQGLYYVYHMCSSDTTD